MPRSRPAYPPEFRQKLIELVHAGRSPGDLAREFEPTAQGALFFVGEEALAADLPAIKESPQLVLCPWRQLRCDTLQQSDHRSHGSRVTSTVPRRSSADCHAVGY